MLSFKTLTSQITEVGDSVTSTGKNSASGSVKRYAYLELADGHTLQRVVVPSGISGKLDVAFQGKQTVELHLAMHKSMTLVVAIKSQDGRLFAMGPTQTNALFVFSFWVCVVIGVPLLFVFGAGIPLLAFAWFINNHIKVERDIRKYVDTLPAPVLI